DPGGNGHVQWIDKQGNAIDPGDYDDLGLPAANGLAFAKSNGRYGFIDKSGRFVIPPVYQQVSAFHDGVATVANDHRAMLTNAKGEPLAQVRSTCGMRVLRGPDNALLWPQALPQNCRQ